MAQATPKQKASKKPRVGKKEIVCRVIDAINERRFEAYDEHLAADLVMHGFPTPPGRDAFKKISEMFQAAIGDFHITIEDQIVSGDKVVTRYTNRGTHRGEFMGVPATGRSLAWSGIQIDRIKGGQIVETWVQFDQLGLLQQIGAIPGPG